MAAIFFEIHKKIMWRCVTEIRVSLFVAHLAWCATEIFISVAHGQVRHKILIFVSRILWRTAHAPHNVLFGAPQMRLFLLVWAPSQCFVHDFPFAS
jgi:hypothetical protein